MYTLKIDNLLLQYWNYCITILLQFAITLLTLQFNQTDSIKKQFYVIKLQGNHMENGDRSYNVYVHCLIFNSQYQTTNHS